jgi:DNA-binding response OmpR family regulator
MTPDTSSHPTILLVEDDVPLAEMLRHRLQGRGYRVWHATNAAEAEAAATEVQPALVILDLMLPDMHGLVLCANLKERCRAPIIICSATKRKDDGLLGFKLGADDFVAKPFSSDELEARIEAVLDRSLRRTDGPVSGDDVLRIGTLRIDRARCMVEVGDTPVHLTPTEYRLLCALADHPDQVVPTDELAERVWGAHDAGIHDALGVHLRRLRGKLRAGPVGAPSIVVVRGFGYRLTC